MEKHKVKIFHNDGTVEIIESEYSGITAVGYEISDEKKRIIIHPSTVKRIEIEG